MTRLHVFDELDSTQDEARRLVDRGLVLLGDAVICDRQRAGRGRFGRNWVSPSGGLYATFVVSCEPVLSLRAGVATAQTLAEVGLTVRLKWPNDLLVGGKKIGGILIETVSDVCLVGIGINLSIVPLATATSSQACGVSCDRDELAQRLAARFAEPTHETPLAEYRRLSATIGQLVRVERGTEIIIGKAADIDDAGRLIVHVDGERIVVSSGECTHLREVSGS